ncbi:MAG: hypothetical protein K5639_05655 [Eubacterium sp.]|nr:hypothetical protein [Eubacterium sp.]
MVIGSSDVTMSSGRAYSRQTRDRSSVSSWGEVLSATTTPAARESRTITQRDEATKVVELYNSYNKNGQPISEIRAKQTEEKAQKLTESETSTTLSEEAENEMKEVVGDALFVRVFASNGTSSEKQMTLRDFFSLLIHRRREDFERFMENFRIGMQGGIVRSRVVSVTFEGESTTAYLDSAKKFEVSMKRTEWDYETSESESTAFMSEGSVMTKDGRKIDFDLTLGLSRSFMEASKGEKESLSAKFIDPLVINFDAPSVELSDKKFEFDLDCDGELDNIAILGQACGYLAYDKNGDGQINDGSELFGAKSGDGFAELSVYDSDGNGWIDEADPIFDKLKIWSKDADGNDKLVGLGVRGIGAIYLGNAPTQFSLNDSSNVTQAMIRSSGVFLREDGSAGTIQQVDMADNKKIIMNKTA